MSTLTVQLPESLKKRIEALAAKEGYTISQFLASAASEKLAVGLTMDYLRREADAGRRADFERYLASVPDVAPPENGRLDSLPFSLQHPLNRPPPNPPLAPNRHPPPAQD